jgi:hypothetical protein
MNDPSLTHLRQAITNLESRVTELEEEYSILRAKVDGIEHKFVSDVEDEARGYHRKPSEAHWQEFFRSQKEAELARAVLDAAVEYAKLRMNGLKPPTHRLLFAVRAYEAAQKDNQGAGDSAHSPTSIPGPSTSAATPPDKNSETQVETCALSSEARGEPPLTFDPLAGDVVDSIIAMSKAEAEARDAVIEAVVRPGWMKEVTALGEYCPYYDPSRALPHWQWLSSYLHDQDTLIRKVSHGAGCISPVVLNLVDDIVIAVRTYKSIPTTPTLRSGPRGDQDDESDAPASNGGRDTGPQTENEVPFSNPPIGAAALGGNGNTPSPSDAAAGDDTGSPFYTCPNCEMQATPDHIEKCGRKTE